MKIAFYEFCDVQLTIFAKMQNKKNDIGKSGLLHHHSRPYLLAAGVCGSIMQADCVSSSPVGALLADVIHILRGVTALAVA